MVFAIQKVIETFGKRSDLQTSLNKVNKMKTILKNKTDVKKTQKVKKVG